MTAETSELWTFSLLVPSNQGNNSDDDDGNTRSTKTELVQLQRRLAEDDPRTFNASLPMPDFRLGKPFGDSSSFFPSNSTAGRRSTDERTSLLAGDETEEEKPSGNTGRVAPLSTTGWTFSSPFWTIQSSILLKMAYKPAWHLLPKYTNNKCNQAQPRTAALLGTAGSSAVACCGCNCCDGTDPFYSVTFTTDDIERTERIPTLHVRGLGECSGVRVYLKYPDCFRLSVPNNVPQPFQEAWDEQVRHSRDNNNTAGDQDTNFLSKIKKEIDHDTQQGDSLPPTKYFAGPTITFAMPKDTVHDDDEPPLIWKVEVPPPQGGPIGVESLTLMDGPLLWRSTMSTRKVNRPTHIYVNGYQSWSFAGSIPLGQPQPKSAMPDVFSKAFNHGGTVPPPTLEYMPPARHSQRYPLYNRPHPESPYTSDFFACITSHERDTVDHRGTRLRPLEPSVIHQPLDEKGGPALVLGWLSQRQQFGVISVDRELQRIQLHASHQGQLLFSGDDSNCGVIQTDWAFAQLESPATYDEEPLVHYLRAVAGYNEAKPLQNGPLLTGWCSWYHYYENISEDSLRTNFAKLAGLRKTCPTNVSVVDDGYMTAWGDWNSLKPGKFSSLDSMKAVADDIRAEKMRPGIWLAPFACDKHSKLVQNHPDWIIRNDQGIPANSSNCGKFFYGLDATNPQVLQHAYNCVRRAVQDWGFVVLKIDFLYAACLYGNGKYDLSLSRAQAMHMALHTIRSAAGSNTFLIGCGCPLGSGVGYVDGMRVSADTGPTWYPAFPLPSWDHGTLPSLRGMIRNSITRAPLGHRWWHNDPDCIMLGNTTRLTLEEIASSASIVALTCGMLLLSDDLTKVSPARMRILTKIFPMTGVSAVVVDLHSMGDSRGLPTMLRLWCTDATDRRDEFRRNKSRETSSGNRNDDYDPDHNEEAGYFGRHASFCPTEVPSHPNERQRSCIHVTKGLGTWTVLSLSNWLDKSAVVHVPPMALAPPPEAAAFVPDHGYHVFAFWSSKYSWIPGAPGCPEDDNSARDHDSGDAEGYSPHKQSFPSPLRPLVSRQLGPHETEIFHIKPVIPNLPQYIGSDIHFSCGHEVDVFHVLEEHMLTVRLSTDYRRSGHIFVFVPIVNTSQIKATCAGEPALWNVIGTTPKIGEQGNPNCVLGRVVQIAVTVHANGKDLDGQITLEF